MDRVWSLDEANEKLGELRERLPRIREARRVLLASGRKVAAHAPANGGGEEGAEVFEATRVLRTELEVLSAEGIILRDADTGLVDFPSEHEDRIVYLCWKLGEDEVAHWHEVDAGMAGRKPL